VYKHIMYVSRLIPSLTRILCSTLLSIKKRSQAYVTLAILLRSFCLLAFKNWNDLALPSSIMSVHCTLWRLFLRRYVCSKLMNIRNTCTFCIYVSIIFKIVTFEIFFPKMLHKKCIHCVKLALSDLHHICIHNKNVA
jgi:hypothetical protein